MKGAHHMGYRLSGIKNGFILKFSLLKNATLKEYLRFISLFSVVNLTELLLFLINEEEKRSEWRQQSNLIMKK